MPPNVEMKAPQGQYATYLVDAYGRENMPKPKLVMANPDREKVLVVARIADQGFIRAEQERQPTVGIDYIIKNLMDGSGRVIEPAIIVVDDKGEQIPYHNRE